jgi:hypothetical protein
VVRQEHLDDMGLLRYGCCLAEYTFRKARLLLNDFECEYGHLKNSSELFNFFAFVMLNPPGNQSNCAAGIKSHIHTRDGYDYFTTTTTIYPSSELVGS